CSRRRATPRRKLGTTRWSSRRRRGSPTSGLRGRPAAARGEQGVSLRGRDLLLGEPPGHRDRLSELLEHGGTAVAPGEVRLDRPMDLGGQRTVEVAGDQLQHLAAGDLVAHALTLLRYASTAERTLVRARCR